VLDHAPARYNELAPTFSKLGVDEIVCLSVNDGFVMSEWQKDQDAPNVTFIPDGNGEFTEKMGMLVDKANLGFGKRSWRYSMLVKDGVVVKQFIEPEKEGDPFEVSDADTMLSTSRPPRRPGARRHLHQARLPALRARQGPARGERRGLRGSAARQERDLLDDPRGVRPRHGPPGLHRGRHIGGAEDLAAYFASGQKLAA